MAKQAFIHTRLSRAYLALARLSCYHCWGANSRLSSRNKWSPTGFHLYTVFRKKHLLTFSFISPWFISGFKQKLQWIYPRIDRFW